MAFNFRSLYLKVTGNNNVLIQTGETNASELALIIAKGIQQKEQSELSLQSEIASIPQKTIDLLSSGSAIPAHFVDKEIVNQVDAFRRKRFFPGFNITETAQTLAAQIQTGELKQGSSNIKSRALAWCIRLLSSTDRVAAEKIWEHNYPLAPCEDVAIAEAFILSAKGEKPEALAKLAKIGSPASSSAAFLIIANSQGAQQAFDWLITVQREFTDLDPDGKLFFLMKCIEVDQWSVLLSKANTLTDDDFIQTPFLFYISAIANLTNAIIPFELRRTVIDCIPLALHDFPLASDSYAMLLRKKAKDYFSKYIHSAESLGLNDAANVASDYIIWLELRDPMLNEAAKKKLQASLEEPEHFLRRLNLALRFGIQVDYDEVNREIDRQTALTGGNSFDAAFARLVLALSQKTPEDILLYIGTYRDEILRLIEKEYLEQLEIEVLARTGQVDYANQRLAKLQEVGLDDESEKKLKQIISEVSSVDPVKDLIDDFQSNSSFSSLKRLVHLFEARNDWERLSHYGSMLFEQTHDIRDAERLGAAFNATNKYDKLAELLQTYPELCNQSDVLQALWCYVLYRDGNVQESSKCLDVLRAKRDDPNDRALAVNIAVASGNWESLASIIENEWNNRNLRSATELIHAAHWGKLIGSQRMQALVHIAVQKANDDPRILTSAYFLAVHGGWENDPIVADWLSKAIEYSKDDGPLKQISIKEVIEQQPDWNRRELDTLLKIKNGEIPIFAAAKLLNRSLIDFFLLPAIANAETSDPRKRVNIYAYSGVRQITQILDAKRVGFDVTSLLTLTLLGVLEETLDAFDEIVIPHSTLGWLLEEKEKTNFHQPSRIAKAKELKQLVDEVILIPFVSSVSINPDLAAEIGEDLAALITEAEEVSINNKKQGIVIRSYPVYHTGSLLDDEADLSLHSKHLCSCSAIIDKLAQRGQLTSQEAKSVRAYLISQNDNKWPDEPEIKADAVLFLDQLSVNYLQHLGLFSKLDAAGFTTYISTAETNETRDLIRYESLLLLCANKIDELKNTLAKGIQSEKIKLGQLFSSQDGEYGVFRLHPTINIFDIAQKVDAVVVDDRFINCNNAIDTGSNKVPILTTSDILYFLYTSKRLDFDKLLDRRTFLRRSGFQLISVDPKEINHHLSEASIDNGVLTESAELKAIRESILQTRMSGVVILPIEVIWLTALIRVVSDILKAQWSQNIDETTSKARSNWLLQFLDMRGWSSKNVEESENKLALFGYEIGIMPLLFRQDNLSSDLRDKYWSWIESELMVKLKQNDLDVYMKIVLYVKNLISHIVNQNFCDEDRIKEINQSDRRRLAMALLQLFPPSIRQALFCDKTFQDEYSLIITSDFVIGSEDVSIGGSELFKAIRSSLQDNSVKFEVFDQSNEIWTVEVLDANSGKIALCKGGNQWLFLPNLWSLFSEASQRISAFRKEAAAVNLPLEESTIWEERLAGDNIDDNLVKEVLSDLNDTPLSVIELIKSELEQGKFQSTFIPGSARYYERLVGKWYGQKNLKNYVSNGIKRHVQQLISWRPKEGLSLSLLMSSHTSISLIIDVIAIGQNISNEVFEEISKYGDRFSQLGAIELGLSMLKEWPDIEPHLETMIEQIQNDKPDEPESHFSRLSSLIRLVDAQLSFNKIFENQPPFYRRLAAITQASMIERCLTEFSFNDSVFSSFVSQSMGLQFYLQTLCDLRVEPRWIPEFVQADQLKAEFLGRIWGALQKNSEVIKTTQKLSEFLEKDFDNSIRSILVFPHSFLPGPLEGDNESSNTIPEELEEAIRSSLAAEKLVPSSFYALINSVLLYKTEKVFAELASRALREARYYVQHGNDESALFPLLSGLALVAAVTRSIEMATELRILTRRSMQEQNHPITPEESFQIGLFSAAAHENLNDWCSFIGEWITELSFGDLTIDEARSLHLKIQTLCHIIPTLWFSLGKAETALNAFLEK